MPKTNYEAKERKKLTEGCWGGGPKLENRTFLHQLETKRPLGQNWGSGGKKLIESNKKTKGFLPIVGHVDIQKKSARKGSRKRSQKKISGQKRDGVREMRGKNNKGGRFPERGWRRELAKIAFPVKPNGKGKGPKRFPSRSDRKN